MLKELKQKRNTERIILIMLIINYSFMIFSAIKLRWNTWIPTFMLIEAAATIIFYVGSYFEYERRARINTILIMISISIYSIHYGEIGPVIVPLIAQIVLIGFYDIDSLMLYPAITLTVIVFYHAVILQSFTINSVDDVYDILVPIGNSYMILLYVHLWDVRKLRGKKELERVTEELEEAECSKDDFMANVSHEIRTPINSISGMSEIVLRDELLDSTRLNVENIKLSCKRLTTIVDDLIDFSDLRTGKYEINDVKYSIDSSVNDIVNYAYSIKKDKSIEIIVDCSSSIPCELIGDETKIKRVIRNILSNAVKFTSEGCIVIKIGYRRESYGINLSFTIKDTGIGIDKHDMEKIFSSFNQVDSKRNRQEGGLGFGLPIARAIVEQMGGVITVTSEPGVGSEFKVVIPQKVENQEPIISEELDIKANILAYLDMEQFHLMQIRDEYRAAIENMSTNINVPVHLCHNLAEFKRRVGLKQYTHYFISLVEYNEDKSYFNDLAEKNDNVIVVIDRYQEDEIESDKIIKLMKPMYIFPVLMALMGVSNKAGTYIATENFKKFTAPDAHVLVVDDDPVNLKVASGLMKTYEVKTDVAGSGAEALKMIDSELYDIIFLDHMMPDMDGIETFRRLRKKNGFYFKEVPVIALTANTVFGAREMFLEEGFQDFLPKPIEVSALKRVLKTYIHDEKIIMENDITEASMADTPIVTDDTQQEDVLQADDFIDYKQGMIYCGSQENLMEVLQLHYEEGNENWHKIKKAYDDEDWKNYVIFVHGLKSSMKSVGINKLSGMAELLEMAGKEENIDYINKNNEALLSEYSRVIDGLEEIFGCSNEETTADLKETDAAELRRICDEFEDIVYSFDPDQMMQVINELKQYSCNGIALADKLVQIEKKIVNSDYMSAADALKRIIDEITTEGDDHAL